jgi:hypothetical protein
MFVTSTTVLRGKEFVATKKPDVGSSPFGATTAAPSQGVAPGKIKRAANIINKNRTFIKNPSGVNCQARK